MQTPIIMGDFNNGPAPPGVNFVWQLPFHYGLINSRGFVSPYVLEDGKCTFCTSVSEFTKDFLLDHIFVTTASYKGRVLSSEVYLYIVCCPQLPNQLMSLSLAPPPSPSPPPPVLATRGKDFSSCPLPSITSCPLHSPISPPSLKTKC
jgi:hypothetical protein